MKTVKVINKECFRNPNNPESPKEIGLLTVMRYSEWDLIAEKICLDHHWITNGNNVL